MGRSLLRVALVWQGEMMADHVASGAATAVTLGTSPRSTFVVPVLDVPDGFAVLRREGEQWMLAITGGIGGQVHVDGALREVAELAVQLVPLGARDWGVLELGSGGLQLFFQFVEDDAPLPRSRSNWDLLTPALAFALLLHAILLVTTYVFDDGTRGMAFPGTPRFRGEFLVQRVKAPPEPEPAKPGATVPSTTPSGASGGGGAPGQGEPDAGELIDPTPRPAPPAVAPPDAGLLRRPNRAIIESVIDQDVRPALGRFLGLPGRDRARGPGYGPGPGTRPGPGVGPGQGPGHNVGPPGDEPLDVGPIRARTPGPTGGGAPEVQVRLLPPKTDAVSLTHAEISKIVESRAGLIRACYQRGADRRRGLSGTLTVRFVIAPEGQVTLSRIARDASTLDDAQVEACVLRQIDRLRFPAKGGGTVTFPFRFDIP
jgi:TonB family protein